MRSHIQLQEMLQTSNRTKANRGDGEKCWRCCKVAARATAILLMWRFSEQNSLLACNWPKRPALLHFPLLPEFLFASSCKNPRRTTANLHLLRHNPPSVDCKALLQLTSSISGDIQAILQNVPERPQTIDPCRRRDEPVRRCRFSISTPNTSRPRQPIRASMPSEIAPKQSQWTSRS